MRIISGKYRGKKLLTPADASIRPTSDRARESIYNILNSKLLGDWENNSILDVFTGTGAFALEAISRGIKEACLIDSDTNLAEKNSNLFPQEKTKIKILRSNALNLPLSTKQYDILFMDAPYSKNLTVPTLIELHKKNWLKHNALCIIEVEKAEEVILPEFYEGTDIRQYGIAKIIFARYIQK